MKKIKTILFIIMSIAIFKFYNYLITNIEIKSKNENFVKRVMKSSNSHLVNESQSKNYVHEFINLVAAIDINKPVTILQNGLDYNYSDKVIFSYITNDIVENPKVYIYNSHPLEEYNSDSLEGYEIKPGVLLASILLQEKLNFLGIETIVENRSTTSYLKERGLNYNDSYVASRVFVNDRLKDYPNINLIIDLHRDAVDKNVTTINVEGKDYAKIMFVQNPNLNENIEFATKFNFLVESKINGLSRGLYTKHKSNFNQDLNKNMVLLELGGNHNTMEEVINTIDVISNVIKEML